MLDLFCGRFGWGGAFAERGWEVVGVDLVEPPEMPVGCEFIRADISTLRKERDGLDISMATMNYMLGQFDFICASSPCEEFSVHGMKHFHPNPKYPEMGIKLFNHTRALCEATGVPYVMENVRPAQQFVGNAVNHCGPFYLWGTGVPPILPQGIVKGIQLGGNAKGWAQMTPEQKRAIRKTDFMVQYQSGSKERRECTAKAATIPPELAACVAEYATRLCETLAVTL